MDSSSSDSNVASVNPNQAKSLATLSQELDAAKQELSTAQQSLAVSEGLITQLREQLTTNGNEKVVLREHLGRVMAENSNLKEHIALLSNTVEIERNEWERIHTAYAQAKYELEEVMVQRRVEREEKLVEIRVLQFQNARLKKQLKKNQDEQDPSDSTMDSRYDLPGTSSQNP